MPSRRLIVASTTADALSDEEIRQVTAPSRVSLWAAAVTKTDTIGLRIGRTIILEEGEMNIEESADVIDTDRDQLIFAEPVGPGVLRLPVTVTTEAQLLLVVQPLR